MKGADMADIKNKNELKRRIDLFLDDFSHEEYMINEPFCKETMRMMREFIGHASHLLDCTDAKIKKAKRTARNKAIDEFAERFIYKAVCEGCSGCCNCYEEEKQSKCEDWKTYMKIAEEMRGAV